MPTESEIGEDTTVPDAFYLPLGGERFLPTEHTSGPWSPDAQHFGPPSALLVRALEEVPAEREMMLSRVTVEILGPAPLRELTLTARLERPGRAVEYLSAELATDERVVARASAWRLAAIDWRAISGAVAGHGAAAVWARQRVALVDGEKPSGLQRLFTIADSGSGVSGRLDPARWWFINSELTVHLQRPPSGEWIGLDATTTIGPNGVGTATSRLCDESGQVALGAQALLVRPR